jgi:hypothetical protein
MPPPAIDLRTTSCSACGAQLPAGTGVCPVCGSTPNFRPPSFAQNKVTLVVAVLSVAVLIAWEWLQRTR